MFRRVVLGSESLTLLIFLDGRVATINVPPITPVPKVPIPGSKEVFQVFNLEILPCLLVIVHAHSAIRYGIYSGFVVQVVSSDSTESTRSVVLITSSGEL